MLRIRNDIFLGFAFLGQFLNLLVLQRSAYKTYKQRMRFAHRAFQLWVELHANKPRVVGQLNNFYQIGCRVDAGHHHTTILKSLQISIVELISMAMTFVNYFFLIKAIG